MKIAVPVFGSRVSPRFDCAQTFLLVTTADANSIERQQLAATNWTARQRVDRLRELGVSAVICGGIDTWSAESLRAAGIAVYNSITGDVDEALVGLLRGGRIASPGAPTGATLDVPPGGDRDSTTAGQSNDEPGPYFGLQSRRD